MTRDEVLARALQFLFAARQRVQRNGSAMESARTHGSSFLFAARQRVQRNPHPAPLTPRRGSRSFYSLLASEYSGTILRNGERVYVLVSIRCSPASTAELIDGTEYVPVTEVSIRCSPASTAEPYPARRASDQPVCSPSAQHSRG